MKIGVFDSGVGGITVLTALRERFPSAHFVYLGDTAHLPYGAKSASQIEKLSIACAKKLVKKNIDVLIVACNTASSLALSAIKKVMGCIPVYGVVGPGVQAALSAYEQTKSGAHLRPILVLATRATVQSHAYGKAFRQVLGSKLTREEGVFPIIEQACPLLVPMIEEGWIDHPILHQTIAEYIQPYLKTYSSGVALLGCTHYPWIHAAFERAMPGWTIVNSAQAVVDSLEIASGLQKKEKQRQATQNPVEWVFTDSEVVPAFAKKIIE